VTVVTSASTSTAAEATSARSLSLARGCPVAAVVLLLPGRPPLVLGPVVSTASGRAGLSGLAYPADGSIVTGSDVSLAEGKCGKSGPKQARAQLRSLSLFAGTVTADRTELSVGKSSVSSAAGLAVDGLAVPATPGAHVQLSSWGDLTIRPADPVAAPDGGLARSALVVRLRQPHAGLPAGTVVLVSVAGLPAARRNALPATQPRRRATVRRGRHVASHAPLKVTPPLGLRQYVFPVVGPSSYIDTYGAFRGDVPGKWHHGDDIFAPLGTPVVAVASGTINRVGWEELGGWRLWVRDSVGDQFYYAHLSGYAPSSLRSNRVRAGQVVGFVGNTGDAFTTAPHLHFEVHPRPLLHLGYDGAVDPTRYLDHWAHLARARAPVPAHPRLPASPTLQREARYVFRELLAARHLIKHAPKPSERPKVTIPAGANGMPIAAPALEQSAPAVQGSRTRAGAGRTFELLVAAATLAVVGALVVPPLRRRSGRREPEQPAESTNEDG
jgi:murein DD-endopeptidase MepM/ murein hydrolase activator NlpD